MEEAIGDIKKKYGRHLAIQIWYYYRKYRVYKTKKDAAKRKKDMDAAAKKLAKGGKGGPRRATVK